MNCAKDVPLNKTRRKCVEYHNHNVSDFSPIHHLTGVCFVLVRWVEKNFIFLSHIHSFSPFNINITYHLNLAPQMRYTTNILIN